MATLREKLWLWAQSPDAHYEYDNPYKLPGHSRMSAAEGAYYIKKGILDGMIVCSNCIADLGIPRSRVDAELDKRA